MADQILPSFSCYCFFEPLAGHPRTGREDFPKVATPEAVTEQFAKGERSAHQGRKHGQRNWGYHFGWR